MNALETFKSVKTFVFDVDGVLTDHGMFVFENGKIVRKLNEKDLLALRMAIQQKFRIAIISGGSLGGLIPTFQAIGITDIYEKTGNKKAAYESLRAAYDLNDIEVLYMGDDLPDYEVMRIIGMPVCPHNAALEVIEISEYCSPFKGGEGCVRDVIEKVLKLQNKWKV